MPYLGQIKKYNNLNNRFYKKNKLTHKVVNGEYVINFKFSGFDKDPLTSLIIEAQKNKHIKITKKKTILIIIKKNYNRYGHSLLQKKDFKKKLKSKKINF